MTKQVDIKTASNRVVHETPGHTTFAVWVNGGKAGELTVRNEERVAMRQALDKSFNKMRGEQDAKDI